MEVIIDYGMKARDKLTGYEGAITAIIYYFDQKPRLFLIEGLDSTGRPVQHWVQENRIELI